MPRGRLRNSPIDQAKIPHRDLLGRIGQGRWYVRRAPADQPPQGQPRQPDAQGHRHRRRDRRATQIPHEGLGARA